MSQVFHRSANTISRVSIIGAGLLAGGLLLVLFLMFRSPIVTAQGIPREQPVQFSHLHHVSDNGIDCRYCHTTAETAASAGIPPTQTCMNCHAQIWTNAPELEPVRQSWATGEPLNWNRVHDMPDYVYFNHSVHVQNGVGCESCHGRVDQMALVYKAEPMTMEWCLECHRDPSKFVRPKDQVFTMGWHPVVDGQEVDQSVLGPQLVEEYGIESKTDCWYCHR